MSTHCETLNLPHGYKAEIHYDQSPDNPWTSWDCNPPIAVCNLERYNAPIENYGGEELNLETLLDYIPATLWASHKGKRAIIDALPDSITPESVAAEMRYSRDTFKDALRTLARELTPSGWRDATEYFDAMEYIAALAGIPCHNTQSNGNSQGDCALVFVAALPKWVEEVGAPDDTLADQCKAAADLWSAWAWGDVYGVASITRPANTEDEDEDEDEEGDEIPYGACWGFYGSDYHKSGLMEFCLDQVECDRQAQDAEHAREHEAACRDILTTA